MASGAAALPVRSVHRGRRIATYRKVAGGFRSDWGAYLFAAVHPSSAQPADKASMPMTQSSPLYAEMPSSLRVEQLL